MKESGTHLFPQLHDLETIKVIELPPLLELSAALCPVAGSKLGLNLLLLPQLPDGSVTSGAGKAGKDNGGERKVRELGGVAGHDLFLG